MKFLLLRFLLVFIILFCISTRIVSAAEYFSTTYKVVYTVHEDGKTSVVSNMTLTNTTDDFYAGSYTMRLGFEDVENLKASDKGGSIDPTVKKTDTGTTVDIPFNTQVFGKNNANVFTLTFDSSDVAKKQGNIWEINIPKIPSDNNFTSFTAEVKVPSSFGRPIYIKPQQENNSLIFTKDQLEKSGVSIAFGQQQIYSFTLYYHLKNKNLFPIKTQIAIPPNTNYQEVLIDSMDPKPYSVAKDSDGNWLAEYRLLPVQKIDVSVKGKSLISLFPKPEEITSEQKAEYTKEKKYWEVSDPKIKILGKQLKTPEAIYDYVVKNLIYDFTRVTDQKARLGAVQTLSHPNSAVCLEFTDLFIALARAAGIPAREMEGFAYTDNPKQRPLSLAKDILHAWPEYYDFEKKTWIMIDPTWGNSTGGNDYFHQLDFDHFVFVQKGYDSEFPIPPSGYKYASDIDKKDVHVDFAETFDHSNSTYTADPIFDNTYLSAVPIRGILRVTNTGKRIIPRKEILVTSDALLPLHQLITSGEVLPFGFVEVPITFDKTPFLTNRAFDLTITIDQEGLAKRIFVTPLLLNTWTIIGGLFFGVFTISLCIAAIKAWRLFVSGQKR